MVLYIKKWGCVWSWVWCWIVLGLLLIMLGGKYEDFLFNLFGHGQDVALD